MMFPNKEVINQICNLENLEKVKFNGKKVSEAKVNYQHAQLLVAIVFIAQLISTFTNIDKTAKNIAAGSQKNLPLKVMNI